MLQQNQQLLLRKYARQLFRERGLFTPRLEVQCAFYIVFIRSSSNRFCSSGKELHLENNSYCSGVIAFREELRQCNPKGHTNCFQCWQSRCVIPVEHICNGRMRKVRFLCQSIICPSTRFHHLPICIYYNPRKGDVPTPEEWLKYVVEKLGMDGRDDLLRW